MAALSNGETSVLRSINSGRTTIPRIMRGTGLTKAEVQAMLQSLLWKKMVIHQSGEYVSSAGAAQV